MENQNGPRRRTSQKNKPVIKRLLANKCERERVRKINEAFEVLKTHIPYCDSGRIRTKLDVLKFAIDYIQILSKMVSQNEAAMLLKASQMEGTGFGDDEITSPKSTEFYYPEGSTAFPFNEQSTSLMGMSSPTLSDREVFFGDGLNKEQMPNQFQWDHHQQPQQQYYPQQHEQQQQLEHHQQQQQQPQIPQQWEHTHLQQQQQHQQHQQQQSPPPPISQQQQLQQPATQMPQQWEHPHLPQQIPLLPSTPHLTDPTTIIEETNSDEEQTEWILL